MHSQHVKQPRAGFLLFFQFLGEPPPNHVHNKHKRGAKPPVPEGNKNKECIPERQRAGENAVSGERKCDKEMDAEIPELGPGA